MKKTVFIIFMAAATMISFAQPHQGDHEPMGHEHYGFEHVRPEHHHPDNTVEGSTFFENTYVRIQGGVFMPLTEGVSKTTGIAGIELGKNITPVFGVSIEGWMNFSNEYGGTSIDYSNVVGNLKFNMSNAIGGYKGSPRLVEAYVVPGIGWGHYYTNDDFVSQFDRNYITYNTFAEVDFNLGKKKQYQININPGVVWFAGNSSVNFDINRSAFVVKVGFTYKFGRKGSHNFRLATHK